MLQKAETSINDNGVSLRNEDGSTS